MEEERSREARIVWQWRLVEAAFDVDGRRLFEMEDEGAGIAVVDVDVQGVSKKRSATRNVDEPLPSSHRRPREFPSAGHKT